MDNLERLLGECNLLKSRIQELEKTEVNIHEESYKEIQLTILKKELTKVGWQINRIMIYRRSYDR